MIYIFILILIVMILINLILVRDLLHPTIIFKSIWLISFIVYIFFKDIWGFELNLSTLVIFLIGFVCFDLGFIYFVFIISKFKYNLKIFHRNYKRTLYKSRVILLLILTIVISSVLFLSITKTFGTFPIFSKDFFTTFRQLQYSEDVDQVSIETHLFTILRALAVSTFVFFITENFKSRKLRKIYLVILLIIFISMLFNTGRMWFLSLAIQFFVIVVVNSKKNGSYFNLKTQISYLRKLFIIGVTFLLFFFVYGKVTADKIDFNNAINKIAIYIASPIIAFNETWEERASSSDYFGEYLLSPLYNLIDKFFFTNIVQPKNDFPYVFGNNDFATNVYTFYDSQIRDFGVVAIPFVMFVIGILAAFLKWKSEIEMTVGFWTIVYSYFIFSISLSFFNDKFFLNTTGTYITLIVYFLIFKTKFFNKSDYYIQKRVKSH